MLTISQLVDATTVVTRDLELHLDLDTRRKLLVTKGPALSVVDRDYPKVPVVYILIDSDDGSFYIGSTGRLRNRWIEHFDYIVSSREDLGLGLKAHGTRRPETIFITVLKCESRLEADLIENFLLGKFFGNTLCRNRKGFVEKNYLEAGRANSPETLKKKSEAKKDYFLVPGNKEKFSLTRQGYKLTTKQEEIFVEANNQRSKQITIDGVSYRSKREACRQIGISRTTLKNRILKGTVA